MDCLTNLAQCLTDTLANFILGIVNAPIKPMVGLVQMLLSTPPNFEAFGSLWAAIVYAISLMYGLLVLFAGVNFVINSSSVEKREQAKEWLKNVLLLVFFVQTSYLLYTLIAELASALTTGVIGAVNPQFFLLTNDNPTSAGTAIFFGTVYAFTLLLTTIVLSINYFLTSIGIVFFPIGIFCYYIPPLRDIGRFILNKLCFFLFIPFFASIILAGASKLSTIPPFTDIKVMLMIAAFSTVSFLLIIMALLAIIRAVMGVLRSDAAKAILLLKGHSAGTALNSESRTSERAYWSRPHADYPPRHRKARRNA